MEPKPRSDVRMLVLASYFKGERFLEQAHARGAHVTLLTVEKLLDKNWPRHAIAEVCARKNDATLDEILRTASYLARTRRFDRIAALDDFDVEVAAALREHFRFEGQGDSIARNFRDKLAMRTTAKKAGIPVPDFTGVFNYDEVRDFIGRVPPPWMNKPRSSAGAIGIKKVESEAELWRLIEEQGDEQSFRVLEEYLPGSVYHVDTLVSRGEVVFEAAHGCGAPPFDVAHGGGIFTTITVPYASDEEKELYALNRRVLKALGHVRGAAHTEFIRGKQDGKFYFLECGARVGGAHIADMIEASRGVNLWGEWANLEIDRDETPYALPPTQKREYGGLIVSLSRQEHPDFSAYTDPEIKYRVPEKNHAGLAVVSDDHARVVSLIRSYEERFRNDFHAALPAADKPEY
ncbi:MAG: ATP-grasp domain-containing protein [Polyangiaceae bacterium]